MPFYTTHKRLSVHITPKRRAEQLPDEMTVKNNQLFCRWCQKSLTSLRMDNIRLHLTSQLHRENKLKLGAPLTVNNGMYFVIDWLNLGIVIFYSKLYFQ